MSLASQIKPISYLKASTAQAVREVQDSGEPLFITQNGEARIVVQDIHSWERERETLAMLRLLALGEAEAQRGETVSADEALSELRERLGR